MEHDPEKTQVQDHVEVDAGSSKSPSDTPAEPAPEPVVTFKTWIVISVSVSDYFESKQKLKVDQIQSLGYGLSFVRLRIW
jgi:hypothetical protein